MCAMEMVAWLAGEAHGDEPSCTCPVLAALVRACNDAMSDRARDRFLRPLVPQLVNTRSTAAVERARGLLAIDCAVRTLLPTWLDRRGRKDEAALLRALPPVTGPAAMLAARRALATFVRDRHAALWVLDRARDGLPPARFVAGIVQVARSLDDASTWTEVVRLVERMVAAGAGGVVGAVAEATDASAAT
jgi:hypothetical protein